MTDVDPRWYDGFFEVEWLDYVQPEADVTLQQVDFLVDELGLDAVVNLFSAFGYFAEDVENERVVQRIATALRPGGRFVIDTNNPITLARVLRERDWHELEDGSVLLVQRRHDQLSGRIRGTWTVVRQDGSRSVLEHSTRVYTPAELSTLLGRAGIDAEQAWGNFDRTELGDGIRTILLARKRE